MTLSQLAELLSLSSFAQEPQTGSRKEVTLKLFNSRNCDSWNLIKYEIRLLCCQKAATESWFSLLHHHQAGVSVEARASMCIFYSSSMFFRLILINHSIFIFFLDASKIIFFFFFFIKHFCQLRNLDLAVIEAHQNFVLVVKVALGGASEEISS